MITHTTWEHIDRMLACTSLQAAKLVVRDFTRALGFRNHGFAMRTGGAAFADQSDYLYFEDFNNAWSSSYARLGQVKVECADARIQFSARALPAMAWDLRGRSSYPIPGQKLLQVFRNTLRTADEYELRGGLTVPIANRGVRWSFLSFTHDSPIDPREMIAVIASADYFAHCLQASLDRLLRPRTSQPIALSIRELDVLRWTAAGRTSAQIAQAMRISESTVNFHLRRATAKLDVKGRRAASAKAMALGLIGV